jgi:hypothetical protein
MKYWSDLKTDAPIPHSADPSSLSLSRARQNRVFVHVSSEIFFFFRSALVCSAGVAEPVVDFSNCFTDGTSAV